MMRRLRCDGGSVGLPADTAGEASVDAPSMLALLAACDALSLASAAIRFCSARLTGDDDGMPAWGLEEAGGLPFSAFLLGGVIAGVCVCAAPLGFAAALGVPPPAAGAGAPTRCVLKKENMLLCTPPPREEDEDKPRDEGRLIMKHDTLTAPTTRNHERRRCAESDSLPACEPACLPASLPACQPASQPPASHSQPHRRLIFSARKSGFENSFSQDEEAGSSLCANLISISSPSSALVVQRGDGATQAESADVRAGRCGRRSQQRECGRF